jgi:hypothetical protein
MKNSRGNCADSKILACTSYFLFISHIAIAIRPVNGIAPGLSTCPQGLDRCYLRRRRPGFTPSFFTAGPYDVGVSKNFIHR